MQLGNSSLIVENTSRKFIIELHILVYLLPTFAIIDTKIYVPVVTLSTQDNVKLLQQLKSEFKKTINCNKYQSKVSIQRQSQYLDYLTDPNFTE